MLEFVQEEGELRCVFAGALNTTQCSEIEEGLFAKVDEAGLPVVFDLKAVDYVSSAFLRLCVGVGKRAGAGKFTVANTQPGVKKVFMISGFQGFLA